jgi:hypothetical protein
MRTAQSRREVLRQNAKSKALKARKTGRQVYKEHFPEEWLGDSLGQDRGRRNSASVGICTRDAKVAHLVMVRGAVEEESHGAKKKTTMLCVNLSPEWAATLTLKVGSSTSSSLGSSYMAVPGS